MDKLVPAILVDYGAYSNSPSVRAWLASRRRNSKVIGLGDVSDDDMGEFDAVLRNTKHMDDLVFKTTALCVVQDSLTTPVVAVDDDYEVLDMYEAGGVLVTFHSVEIS